MRTEHVHIWGAKGRSPRTGDLCLSCPAEYHPRASGYVVVGLAPRAPKIHESIARHPSRRKANA